MSGRRHITIDRAGTCLLESAALYGYKSMRGYPSVSQVDYVLGRLFLPDVSSDVTKLSVEDTTLHANRSPAIGRAFSLDPISCHSAAGGGLRYSDRIRTARAQEYEHHHGFYPCVEPGLKKWSESSRSALTPFRQLRGMSGKPDRHGHVWAHRVW